MKLRNFLKSISLLAAGAAVSPALALRSVEPVATKLGWRNVSAVKQWHSSTYKYSTINYTCSISMQIDGQTHTVEWFITKDEGSDFGRIEVQAKFTPPLPPLENIDQQTALDQFQPVYQEMTGFLAGIWP